MNDQHVLPQCLPRPRQTAARLNRGDSALDASRLPARRRAGGAADSAARPPATPVCATRPASPDAVDWIKMLASSAVYATLIVTFVGQVARVDGQSMAPTLADQDRLLVNKLAYRIGDPKVGDVVMLYYPVDPTKAFVKRVIAAEGDQVQIVDGRVVRNGAGVDDAFVAFDYRSHEDWGPKVIPEATSRDGRSPHKAPTAGSGLRAQKYTSVGQFRWWPRPCPPLNAAHMSSLRASPGQYSRSLMKRPIVVAAGLSWCLTLVAAPHAPGPPTLHKRRPHRRRSRPLDVSVLDKNVNRCAGYRSRLHRDRGRRPQTIVALRRSICGPMDYPAPWMRDVAPTS